MRWAMSLLFLALMVAVPAMSVAGQSAPTNSGTSSPATAPRWQAIDLPGRVTESVNLRSAPSASDDEIILRTLEPNDGLWIYESLTGDDGDQWYRVGDDQYVHAAEIRLPRAPEQTWEGHWIDVDLNTPAMLTAYDGDKAVFSALAIKGRAAMQTPVGTYNVIRRVEDETMDSQTLGVPRNAPGGYYLQHVMYTQYIRNDGVSIHDNYWSDNFGEEGSHGCVGLSLDDSKWVWDWATLGTVVNIHA
jgi:hypothetical protein